MKKHMSRSCVCINVYPLDAEMDDLFGPSTQAEGEEDTPLFREGQIPF